MTFDLGYFLLGTLLIAVAALGSVAKRLPFTTTMIYLVAGVLVGPLGLGFVTFDVMAHTKLLERLAEIAVVVSLFTTGLKLRVPLRDGRWRVPLRLAFGSMALTVGLIAVAGVFCLGLSWGAAILIGAILAPTDPVLASDVQIENPHDRDRLRFSLSGEAGLNDGTAFPFVMLGLGMLGLHDLGPGAWKWWTVDVVWAIAGGLGIGAACGGGTGRLVLYLRREHREGLGSDHFIALGLIALSYGLALLLHAYGFLAVFAAGLALRAVERRETGDRLPDQVLETASAEKREEIATATETAPAHLAGAVLSFNEQMERVLEVALVLIVGVLLSSDSLRLEEACFIALLFVAIRPAAVLAGLLGSKRAGGERALLGWFGIRGIGSIYYLMYAANHGIDADLARHLTAITLTVIAVSIVLHGITVTPLMAWHHQRRQRSAACRDAHVVDFPPQ